MSRHCMVRVASSLGGILVIALVAGCSGGATSTCQEGQATPAPTRPANAESSGTWGGGGGQWGGGGGDTAAEEGGGLWGGDTPCQPAPAPTSTSKPQGGSQWGGGR
jgi:hypothetical protein